MNPNIQVITENLWAVNFQYVKMEYIQELNFTHVENGENKIACIKEDGIIVLNKEFSNVLHSFIPFLKEVMTLKDKDLHTKQGFCKVMRSLVPKAANLPDSKIMNFVWKENPNIWTTYRNACNWEKERREVEKAYMKKHPLFACKKFLKGGEQ